MAKSRYSQDVWDTRSASKSNYGQISKSHHGWSKHTSKQFFWDPSALYYRGHERNRRECLFRRVLHPEGRIFHCIELSFTKSKLKAIFSKISCYKSNPLMELIIDEDGIERSVTSGASAGFISVHLMTHMHDYDGKNYGVRFFIFYEDNDDLFFEVDFRFLPVDVNLTNRLACPLPLRLKLQNPNDKHSNPSSWVCLHVDHNGIESVKSTVLYAYFQTVEIQETLVEGVCTLVTKINLIELCPSLIDPIRLEYRVKPTVISEILLHTVLVPLKKQERLSFDISQPDWHHHFLWRKLKVGMTGFRIQSSGRFSAYVRTKLQRFVKVAASRVVMSVGYHTPVEMSMKENDTGSYRWKPRGVGYGFYDLVLYI